MSTLLYRPSLDVRSGAGQLVLMQLEGLEAAGEPTELGCARGAWRFRLRTGRRVRRLSSRSAGALTARGRLVVDHGSVVPGAQVAFVHNCFGEALRYLQRADWLERAEHEAAYFERLDSDAVVIANSELVKRALVARYAIAAERVDVQYPGYDVNRFRSGDTPALRSEARRALGLSADVPLVGFVTSGDFDKRGLDTMLGVAARMRAVRSDLHCLVVGSKRLPGTAAEHALSRSGHLHHRPKGARPELWMAALDVFVYPAVFEEFGMVVLEAMALGVPVLTSACVGAAECLPRAYAPWLLEHPEEAGLAVRALSLLDDESSHAVLANAGVARAATLTSADYAARTVASILAQKRRLK